MSPKRRVTLIFMVDFSFKMYVEINRYQIDIPYKF